MNQQVECFLFSESIQRKSFSTFEIKYSKEVGQVIEQVRKEIQRVSSTLDAEIIHSKSMNNPKKEYREYLLIWTKTHTLTLNCMHKYP